MFRNSVRQERENAVTVSFELLLSAQLESAQAVIDEALAQQIQVVAPEAARPVKIHAKPIGKLTRLIFIAMTFFVPYKGRNLISHKTKTLIE